MMHRTKELLGCAAVFCSALFFYLATVVITWSKAAGLSIDPAFFVFARFLTGFVVVTALLPLSKKPIRINTPGYLIGRTVANCIAVFCFFKGVDLSSAAQANILNMTYPLFIVVISVLFLKEKPDAVTILFVVLSFAGVWLILGTGIRFQPGAAWGLASGISAAIAIIYLDMSRHANDTQTTLFCMFGLGSIIIFCLFHNRLGIPGLREFGFLAGCSAFAVTGQYLLTLGFKYVTAVEGGVFSSSRIIMAAFLGPFIAFEPRPSLSVWVGALLIFSGNVYLTLRRARGSLSSLPHSNPS